MTKEMVEPVDDTRMALEEGRRIASGINGKLVHIDKNIAVRFRVIEEAVDLTVLRDLLVTMEGLLRAEPESEEVILKRARAEQDAECAELLRAINRIRAELGE